MLLPPPEPPPGAVDATSEVATLCSPGSVVAASTTTLPVELTSVPAATLACAACLPSDNARSEPRLRPVVDGLDEPPEPVPPAGAALSLPDGSDALPCTAPSTVLNRLDRKPSCEPEVSLPPLPDGVPPAVAPLSAMVSLLSVFDKAVMLTSPMPLRLAASVAVALVSSQETAAATPALAVLLPSVVAEAVAVTLKLCSLSASSCRLPASITAPLSSSALVLTSARP